MIRVFSLKSAKRCIRDSPYLGRGGGMAPWPHPLDPLLWSLQLPHSLATLAPCGKFRDHMVSHALTLYQQFSQRPPAQRPVHTERLLYGFRYVDGQMRRATNSARHRARQKDQRCRPSMLRELLSVHRP